MGFHTIQNNDPASADVVMENFTHVNYGSPLLPTNIDGQYNNGILDIGSPTNKWDTIYTNNAQFNNIQTNNGIHYPNANHGDIHFINNQKKQQTLPAGPNGHILKSNGPNANPSWTPLLNGIHELVMQPDDYIYVWGKERTQIFFEYEFTFTPDLSKEVYSIRFAGYGKHPERWPREIIPLDFEPQVATDGEYLNHLTGLIHGMDIERNKLLIAMQDPADTKFVASFPRPHLFLGYNDRNSIQFRAVRGGYFKYFLYKTTVL